MATGSSRAIGGGRRTGSEATAALLARRVRDPNRPPATPRQGGCAQQCFIGTSHNGTQDRPGRVRPFRCQGQRHGCLAERGIEERFLIGNARRRRRRATGMQLFARDNSRMNLSSGPSDTPSRSVGVLPRDHHHDHRWAPVRPRCARRHPDQRARQAPARHAADRPGSSFLDRLRAVAAPGVLVGALAALALIAWASAAA